MKQFLYKQIVNHGILLKKTLPRPSIKQLIGKKNLIIAEIGTFKGYNAESILKTLDVTLLYCIDAYEKNNDSTDEDIDSAYKIARNRLRKFGIKVTFDINYSKDAVKNYRDNFLDLVYIDADHSYESVKQDIELWYNKVKKGGIIAGHDIDHSGVIQAVGEFTLKNNLKLNTEFPDWWVIK